MSGDNVVVLDVTTRLPIPVKRVLQAVEEWADLEEPVVVLAFAAEDGQLTPASTHSDAPKLLWMVEKFKQQLLTMEDEDV